MNKPPLREQGRLRIGARGRNRTGMTVRSRDFLATSTFAASALALFVVWSTPSPWPGGRRCPPSALYTFPTMEAGLGSALARMPEHPGRSPTLTGFTSGVSPRRLKLFKSLVSTNFTTRAWRDALKTPTPLYCPLVGP